MEANQEVIHRELYNRSRDIIRVYNPTSEDFKFKYDSVWYRVDAKRTKDMERYLAQKFFHDIAQKIIGDNIIRKGEELLNKRAERGQDELLDKYQENVAIWNKVPKMDDKELMAQVFSDVVLGVVEVFGSETAPDYVPQPKKDLINATVDEQIFTVGLKEMPLKDIPYATDTEEKPIIKPIQEEVPDIPLKKSKIAKEVTLE